MGDFGGGAKICGGKPRNAMTADLRRAAKKLLKLVRQQNAYLTIRPGAKLFGGNFSRKAMTADLHRLVKKCLPP